MDKMKKYLIYIILLVLFAIFTEALIAVGLSSTYKTLERKEDNYSQISIFQAEATKVNGRIRGVIDNSGTNKINKKYLKFEFYTPRDVYMGCTYVELDSSKDEIPLEVFFKLNNVSYYKISAVDEKEPQGEIDFIPKDLDKVEVFFSTLTAIMLFK